MTDCRCFEPRVVAALYVERGGPYLDYPHVDPWDRERDARRYDGPHPVVAHPPCGPWGELRHLYKGDEHDCAAFALASVRRFGSKFWAHAGVVSPGSFDDLGGFSVDVDQCAWGHVARKRTRLYFVGVGFELVSLTILTGGTSTHWCSGTRKHNAGGGSAPPGIKFCSAQQRRRTPILFADWLIGLARVSRVSEAAA